MRTLGRHPLLVGLIGAGLITLLAIGSLSYDKLPFFNQNKTYSAYFAEAGGLSAGAPVQVSGFRVGKITSVELDGPRVLVTFGVNRAVRLGERTEAAAKTKTPIPNCHIRMTCSLR